MNHACYSTVVFLSFIRDMGGPQAETHPTGVQKAATKKEAPEEALAKQKKTEEASWRYCFTAVLSTMWLLLSRKRC